VTDGPSDAELAAELAEGAGRRLLDLRANGGLEGKALGEAGDRMANGYLIRHLAARRPHDGVLSEESKDTAARLAKERVWIVDPLDGTREFGEARADWAVHVGLAIGGSPEVGAVALPGLDGGVVLRSDRPRPLPAPSATPRLLVSRTRPAAEAVAVADALGGELLEMGSAGAKAMAVVLGQAEIYLHSGGQYEWDNCAPVAVAKAHGLHCSRIDGTALVYNNANPYLPDLLICRPEWAAPVLAEVAKL
jgi:3'(2'), 5'-bisphosphate nucleotidase